MGEGALAGPSIKDGVEAGAGPIDEERASLLGFTADHNFNLRFDLAGSTAVSRH